MSSHPYDRDYYQHSCGVPYERNQHWLSFFGTIADGIVDQIGPATVMDAGCAMGFLVEALRDRGVDAYGVDISEYAFSQVRDDVRPYVTVASVTDPFPRRYDLIVCIEVLEHLESRAVTRAVDNFCGHADDILFTSTPDDVTEQTHLSVKPTHEWVRLFAERSYFRDVDFDPGTALPAWAIRFRKGEQPIAHLAAGYERFAYGLVKENHALRISRQEREKHIAALESDVAQIKASAAYRLAVAMQKTVGPGGSRRRKAVSRFLGRKTPPAPP